MLKYIYLEKDSAIRYDGKRTKFKAIKSGVKQKMCFIPSSFQLHRDNGH